MNSMNSDVKVESLDSEKMSKNSLVSMGNLTRLAGVIKRAMNGEDIKVAFIGGSITQGSSSTKLENSYAYQVYNWFVNKLANIKVNYINAGVGATGSLIGSHRVKKEVLDFYPDIVFVEFAVNDKEVDSSKVGYESLIRRVLSNSNNPAVIEFFMTLDDGWNTQPQQSAIGGHYDLPMISFRDAVQAEIKAGSLEWKEIGADNVHPNDKGHYIAARLLINFLEQVCTCCSEVKGEYEIPEDCVFGEAYVNGNILNSTSLMPENLGGFVVNEGGFQTFKYGWKTEASKEGIFKVDIEGTNIYLLYKKSPKNNMAKAIVKVEGTEEITVDSYFENGWGDYSETIELVKGKEKGKHTIEIDVKKINEDDEFTILGFLVS